MSNPVLKCPLLKTVNKAGTEQCLHWNPDQSDQIFVSDPKRLNSSVCSTENAQQ